MTPLSLAPRLLGWLLTYAVFSLLGTGARDNGPGGVPVSEPIVHSVLHKVEESCLAFCGLHAFVHGEGTGQESEVWAWRPPSLCFLLEQSAEIMCGAGSAQGLGFGMLA